MSGSRPSRMFTLVVTLAMALGTLTATAWAAARLTATYSATDQGSWTQGKYVVANGGDTASANWRIEFDLPAGTTIGTVTYGVKTVAGNHVTIDAEYYNKAVRPGGNTEPYSPWFQLFGGGQPANCRINGDKCDGSPDQPPGAPTGLRSTGSTTRTVALAWTAGAAGDFPVTEYLVDGGGTATVSGTTAIYEVR